MWRWCGKGSSRFKSLLRGSGFLPSKQFFDKMLQKKIVSLPTPPCPGHKRNCFTFFLSLPLSNPHKVDRDSSKVTWYYGQLTQGTDHENDYLTFQSWAAVEIDSAWIQRQMSVGITWMHVFPSRDKRWKQPPWHEHRWHY